MSVSIMTGGIRLSSALWSVKLLVTSLCLASIGCIAESPGVLHLHESDSTDAPPASTPEAGAPEATPAPNDTPAAVDNGATLTAIAAQYSTSPAFKRVSRAPYPSNLAPGVMIDTFVSAQAYDAYTRISPDSVGSKASTPPGTVIVRAVVNAKDDTVEKLTLMVKGPAGYNPELGDWWFGVTNSYGVPLLNDDGTKTQTGKMAKCYGCHIPRANDDYLFGVPVASRMAHP